MSDILTEIEARRAYRAIDSRRVPDDVVDRVMSAAVLAPSCSNNQPWRFIAISDSRVLNEVKLHLSAGNYWAKTAPLIVLVATRHEDDCQNPDGRQYAFFDTGMATQNLMLQAVHEGLCAHPIAGFVQQPVKEIAGIPDSYELITLVILGFPGDSSELNEKHLALETGDRSRKPRGETVGFDTWPESWNS